MSQASAAHLEGSLTHVDEHACVKPQCCGSDLADKETAQTSITADLIALYRHVLPFDLPHALAERYSKPGAHRVVQSRPMLTYTLG